MSRRWYRHEHSLVFVGWDRAGQSFFLSVVDLCPACGGAGEDPSTEEPCQACGGSGSVPRPSAADRPAGTLEEIDEVLGRAGIPFPDYVRADLEADQRTNAADVVYDYADDPRART